MHSPCLSFQQQLASTQQSPFLQLTLQGREKGNVLVQECLPGLIYTILNKSVFTGLNAFAENLASQSLSGISQNQSEPHPPKVERKDFK